MGVNKASDSRKEHLIDEITAEQYWAARVPIVLVVEDTSVIADLFADIIAELGMRVAGPFSTQTKALAWLAANDADIALLDYALRDGTCAEVARTLYSGGVPLVVISGYSREQAGDDFPDCLWL